MVGISDAELHSELGHVPSPTSSLWRHLRSAADFPGLVLVPRGSGSVACFLASAVSQVLDLRYSAEVKVVLSVSLFLSFGCRTVFVSKYTLISRPGGIISFAVVRMHVFAFCGVSLAASTNVAFAWLCEV